ncbi:MAG: carboxypeptidase regulatory-like domain-containing protein, partial [Methanosarcinaceae archaeon]|nr:carboxypeptidase regulatory-like domain-containing protein [Methanosarcinaceae archaeon]
TVMTNTSLSTTTNISGFYNFTGMSNGTYIVNASLAGYYINSTNVTIIGANVTDVNISLSPMPTYLVSGYVTDVSSGLPLDNVTVMTNTSLSTTTNISGFYNFTGMSNGTYIVNASLAGYYINSTNVTIIGANVTDVNISLSPMPTYLVSGYVTDVSSGLPLDNVTVMTNTSLSTTTNASGFYNFTGIFNKTYIVNASLSGYYINSTNVTINGANVTNVNISLSPLPTYFISGYVTNTSSGLPLDNATVMTNTSLSTTTNASGFYNFIGMSNGTYIVNASLAGYSINSTNVTIIGANVTDVNISLSAITDGGGSEDGSGGGGSSSVTYKISGYVRDSYTLKGLNNVNVTLNINSKTITDSTGYYIFSGLNNGSYNISTSFFGYFDNLMTTSINGADITDADIYITLAPIPCTDCHYSFNYMNDYGRPDFYVNQTLSNESVHEALDCKNCHTDTTVHPPPKSGWKWCEDCHASQQDNQTNKKRHNIVNNPWDNLYNGISTVYVTSCTECHDSTLYYNSKNIYGKQNGIDCDYCHSFPDNNIG